MLKCLSDRNFKIHDRIKRNSKIIIIIVIIIQDNFLELKHISLQFNGALQVPSIMNQRPMWSQHKISEYQE